MSGLSELADRLNAAGFAAEADQKLPGFERTYVHDPFGNRIELLEPKTD